MTVHANAFNFFSGVHAPRLFRLDRCAQAQNVNLVFYRRCTQAWSDSGFIHPVIYLCICMSLGTRCRDASLGMRRTWFSTCRPNCSSFLSHHLLGLWVTVYRLNHPIPDRHFLYLSIYPCLRLDLFVYIYLCLCDWRLRGFVPGGGGIFLSCLFTLFFCCLSLVLHVSRIDTISFRLSPQHFLR